MTVEKIIKEFKKEFKFAEDKMEIIKIFEDKGKMTDEYIRFLKKPSVDNNFIAAPGAYLFMDMANLIE
jgi:hypothetical protein